MRYPNLRYGNPTEFQHYAMGVPLHELARRLRRDERTVRDWLNCRARVPWWVPELMRLQHLEAVERHRQMGFAPLRKQFGVARGGVVELPAARPNEKPQLTALRLDDFDRPARAISSGA